MRGVQQRNKKANILEFQRTEKIFFLAVETPSLPPHIPSSLVLTLLMSFLTLFTGGFFLLRKKGLIIRDIFIRGPPDSPKE
jgi:hypothetical protein